MGFQERKIDGFRELNSTELTFVCGGHYHEDPTPSVFAYGFDTNIDLSQFGIYTWDTNNTPDGDNSDVSTVDVGGIEISPNPDGTVDVGTETDLGWLLNINFDLADLSSSIASIAIGSFTGTVDLGGQTASGAYSIDFGGGLTGSVSFSASGGGNFTIGASISGSF